MTQERTDRRDNTLSALTIVNAVLGLLVVLAGGAFIYFTTAEFVSADSDMAERYAQVAEQRLNEHADVIEAEVRDLASEALPPVVDAVVARAKKDYPVYVQVVKREGPILLENIQAEFLRQVQQHSDEYLQAHRQTLLDEFPEHASQENVDRVIREFQQVYDRIAERYYLEEFQRVTTQTQTTWEQLPPAPLPKAGEPSLEEQLADYASDWTTLVMAEPPAQPATDEASTPNQSTGQPSSDAAPGNSATQPPGANPVAPQISNN